MKNTKPKSVVYKKTTKEILKDFIVNSDDSETSSDTEKLSQSENTKKTNKPTKNASKISIGDSSETNDSDEQLFYIKTTKKLIQKKKLVFIWSFLNIHLYQLFLLFICKG